MRKLVVISFLTLDGVMQSPGEKNEDPEGGFKYGGWQVPYFEDVDKVLAEDLRKAGALLLGRKTYEIFAAFWPKAGKDDPQYGAFMNEIPKYVASKTLKKTEWQNSKLLEGDTVEAVHKLKREEGKDIYVFGSADLSQTLMRHGLIDRYLLLIHPLALGSGKRLFREEGPKQDLKLVKSQTTERGTLSLAYDVKRREPSP